MGGGHCVGHHGHVHVAAIGRMHGYSRDWQAEAQRTLEDELINRGIRFPRWWDRMLIVRRQRMEKQS